MLLACCFLKVYIKHSLNTTVLEYYLTGSIIYIWGNFVIYRLLQKSKENMLTSFISIKVNYSKKKVLP